MPQRGEYNLTTMQPVASPNQKPRKPAGGSAVGISDLVRRRLMISKLKEQIKWLNERDPKKQSDKMQGAKYTKPDGACDCRQSHDGDCTIYRALINNRPIDGICTCGYGWERVREGDWSEMYSVEREEFWRQLQD